MNLASENLELLSDQSRRQRLQTKQGVPDMSLGDLEYDVDMDPYLDPFARFGYKPENMRVVEGETSYSPRTGIVSIQPEYLASKRVQSHEYRHGGLNLLEQLYKKYTEDPEMERVLEELYPGVTAFFKRYEDSYDDWSEGFPVDGTAEEKQTYLNTKPTPSEYIMELYDEDGSFNRPAEYYPYSEDVAFFMDNGLGEEVSRYYPQLKKGVDYKVDPYEYQNIEHDGMPTYSGPSVIKHVPRKGHMSDTLDLNSAEQLAKRSRFQAYRKSPGPIDKQWSPGVGETEEFNQILAAEEMARDFYEREKRNEYTKKKGYAQGGAVMNRMEQGIASIPRQTMIRDQPHMLAYITPAEAMLLKQNGGSGLPSHGGVPEFGAVGDFFSAMKDDFMIGTGMKDDIEGPDPSYSTPYQDRRRAVVEEENRRAANPALYKEDDKPQPVLAQPMYQAPAPVNVAPPTMAPISSGQPMVPPLNDQTATNVTNPSDVIARPPAMPIGQRPPNKAYTFQELLGMYQNPYA